MTRLLGTRRTGTHTAALSIVALVLALLPFQQLTAAPASAATPLTVAQAYAGQDGASHQVRGYVVGQPTATSTVVTSGFPNDYALALADTAGTTSTSSMVYVQIPSAFRAAWGLKSNPSLMGKQIDVTGTLAAYFSHPGVTSSTAFALVSGSGGTGGGGTGGGTGGGGTGTGGDGSYDTTYYKNAIGKTGPALRSSLHTIISTGVTKLSYDAVWNALMVTDQDPNNANNVIEVYSGRSVPKNSNGGNPDDWNREHVWAKSHGDFGTATGPGTDLHHLRPEDVSVNGVRGNLDFDNGGSPVAQCTGCLSDSDSFQPRPAVEGDVARMILYMAIRYEGDDGFANLEPDDVVNNGSKPAIGRLSVLLQWSAADPPDAFERHRNDVIYSTYQHNRNPFIDHPEWVQAIFG